MLASHVIALFLTGVVARAEKPAHTAQISVVVASAADPLEQLAARDLVSYVEKLFQVRTELASGPNSNAEAIFLIGSPATNPVIGSLLGHKRFPAIDVQGLVAMKTEWNGKPTIIVGGGSPAATFWAVSELVERWGVRHLLHGDVLPPPRSFELPTSEFIMEPVLPVRQWRVVNEFACGPASWGIAEYRPLIDQLARLKFNRLLVYIWGHEPFLGYEYDGIRRQSSTIFFGEHYPITSDMPGRQLFGNTKEFWNPDLVLDGTPQEKLAAGVRHVRNVMDYGRSRGMQVVVSASLTEFPKEFAPLIRGAQPVHQVGELMVTPSTKTDIDDPQLNGLAATILRATADTYPQATRVALSMPEHRQWIDEYRRAWEALDVRYHISDIDSLENLLERARHRNDYFGGPQRAESEVKGDLVNLYFQDRLIHQRATFGQQRMPHFMCDGLAEELYSILPSILPPGSELLNFIDYTPARILRRREVLRRTPARAIPSILIYTLHDDNVGLLPQLATPSLYQLTRELVRNGWAGFSTRYWLLGDQDLAVAYIARAAWDADLTPDRIYRDQLRVQCGEACVGDMVNAMAAIEKATMTLEWNGLGFAFPVRGMMMKHWTAEPLKPELMSVRDDYRRALASVETARGKAASDRAGVLKYWAGRLRFGIEYMNTVEYVRAGGIAEAAGNRSAAREDACKALGHARTAIEDWAAVARDQSDRGAIAMLAKFVYRPLAAKVKQLSP